VSWPRISIDQLCEAIVDCVNRTAPVVDWPTQFKMIRTTNVKSGWIHLSEVRYVDETTYRIWTRRQVPRRGDVVLTREAPLGEVGMIRNDDTVFLGQRLVSYRADLSKLDPRFLLYSLQGSDLQAQIRALGSGSTVEHMRVPDAKRLMVSTPPLKTQIRIADILSAYDDLIENNTRRIAILEDMARRLFEEWFGAYCDPPVGNQATDLPDGWTGAKLSDWIVDVRDAVDPTSLDRTTPYVGLEHLPRRSTTLHDTGRASDVGSTKLRYQRGDILFGKIRPYFHKVAVMLDDGVCSSDAIVMRPKSRDHLPMALGLTSSDAFVAHATQTSNGTKMPRADWKVLKDYPLPVPDFDTLHQYNDAAGAWIELAAALAASNTNLRATRDLLLPKLISGEIEVRAAWEALETAAA